MGVSPRIFLVGTGVLESSCGAPRQGIGSGDQEIAAGRGIYSRNLGPTGTEELHWERSVQEDSKGLPEGALYLRTVMGSTLKGYQEWALPIRTVMCSRSGAPPLRTARGSH